MLAVRSNGVLVRVLVNGHGSVDVICVGVGVVIVGCVVNNNRSALLHHGELMRKGEAGLLQSIIARGLMHPRIARLMQSIIARLLMHAIDGRH